MRKEFKVTCPCCDTILILDRVSGKVLETRKPLVEESTGDRFKDAFLKVEKDKARVADALDNVKEKQEAKRKAAEDLFNASLKEAKKEKDSIKPNSIFDSD